MTEFAGSQYVIEVIYLVASALFILSLKWMSSPATARHGILAGEVGMVLAIAGTLLHHGIVDYKWITIALVLGSGIGIPLGMVQMTAVPQRTALSHAFGALCVTLVGTAEFYLRSPDVPKFMMSVLSMEVILGGLTFTGSLMAAGKLQEILPQRPITYKGQNLVNLLLFIVAVGSAVYLVLHPGARIFFPIIVSVSLIFGVLLVIPIGGADMPTVISLLNSYAGLSAAAMGFVLDSKLLIIAGALDGSSGLILSIIMSKAMNRSFTNVLFGAFGQVQASAAAGEEAKPVRSATAEEAAAISAAIPEKSVLVALDERGDNIDSAAFARHLRRWRDEAVASTIFVIGGADGLSPDLRRKAKLRIAFGSATWPHQMVRVMLLEQVYRAATILAGHPYHRA